MPIDLYELIRLPLAVALICQLSGQLVKTILYSIRDRRPALDWFISAGGIPSAHTAMVTALTASLVLKRGIGDDLVAVAVVFSAIVIFDALRLRTNVQRHAEVLNALLRPRRDVETSSGAVGADRELSERIGHSMVEVSAGIIWGLMWAIGLR